MGMEPSVMGLAPLEETPQTATSSLPPCGDAAKRGDKARGRGHAPGPRPGRPVPCRRARSRASPGPAPLSPGAPRPAAEESGGPVSTTAPPPALGITLSPQVLLGLPLKRTFQDRVGRPRPLGSSVTMTVPRSL